MIDKIKEKDVAIDYPGKSNTGEPIKDKIFNWVVGRYKKHNHPWYKSDQVVWGGAIYGVSSYFGYAIFFGLFLYILVWVQGKYGDGRAIIMALLFILVRINILIKQMVKLNRNF